MLFDRSEEIRSGKCDAPTITATIRSEVFVTIMSL